jgi:class I fructose-bisphosphate aldolase
MKITKEVSDILANYTNENPGVRANLLRILMNGKLAGTGKLIILPVDQGFEHGPSRSFIVNNPSFDPLYHLDLALEAGLNAFASPLGMLEACASSNYLGLIPTILKINSSNSLIPEGDDPTQAITATVDDALRLGCAAIGYTIYPGSKYSHEMIEKFTYIANEAKEKGLAVVVWSYARGADLTSENETALDVIAYAAHIAALIGAHIIKVKLPSAHIACSKTQNLLNEQKLDFSELKARVAYIKKCCFDGKRLVVFSGGAAKSDQEIITDFEAISLGGGNGSIIGRNIFQRNKSDALALLEKLIATYK